MPTNYNFTNKIDYLSLKFPNISNSAQRLYLLGTQTGMLHAGGVPQPNAKCTISIQNLSSSELSPGKENQALRITPTGTAEVWSSLGLYAGITPRPDNLDYPGITTRTYRVSFSYRSNSTGIGRTFYGSISNNPFGGSGASAGATNSLTIITDTNWHKKDAYSTITFSADRWVGFAYFTNLLATNVWTPSEWIDIADFTFTWDEQPTTTTSFDDQFIPADTFRQGNLFLSGSNSQTKLGDNTTITRSSLVQEFTGSSNWKDIGTGFYNSYGIKSDGSLWCWGNNDNGQLGINDRTDRRTPVQEFTSSNNWKMVHGASSTSNHHTVALKTDGTLWSWGSNADGQLGVNDNITRSTPVQEFTSSSNWVWCHSQIGVTVALKSDGTFWQWGNARLWESLDTLRPTFSTPSQEFTSGTNWKKVIATHGLKTDGTLWAWGPYTKMGTNAAINVLYSSPRQVSPGSLWKDISLSSSLAMHAIKTDGTLWGWGDGDYGEIGNNSSTSRVDVPVQESTKSTWTKVFSGGQATAAIKTDGTLWVWGQCGTPAQGALGLGNRIGVSSPVPHNSSIKNWKKVAFHGSNATHGMFLTYIDPII